jgi:hypothetical protein
MQTRHAVMAPIRSDSCVGCSLIGGGGGGGINAAHARQRRVSCYTHMAMVHHGSAQEGRQGPGTCLLEEMMFGAFQRWMPTMSRKGVVCYVLD